MTPFSFSKIATIVALTTLTACANTQGDTTADTTPVTTSASVTTAGSNAATLDSILATQDDAAKQRYQYRNPKETLQFFGIEPGMTVVEVLPGGGWYTKILLPYLGSEGMVIGADYPLTLWNNFSWMTPERLEAKKTWTTEWVSQASEWRGDNSAQLAAFQFADMPAEMQGTADAVLFIRALHNLHRFEEKSGYLTTAMAESFAALKPGGTLGVVQHQASEDQPDSWADGNNGYLKQSRITEIATAAGFEFVAQSAINNNAKDQAVEGDNVWRLPPALSGAKDDPVKKAAAEAIGESNRMTLKFRKPV